MAVTVTNKQIVATLKAAKEHLWDGIHRYGLEEKEAFICFAVELADSTNVGEKAMEIIGKRLWPQTTMVDWLLSQGVPKNEITSKRVQKHRHAWLDLLIEEFSK